MTPGRHAALAGAIFFATGGVVLFAQTLPPPAPFMAGLGWAWVLGRVMRWAESVDA